ncbi:MAG: tripartite tricarboxylate transporter substrate binding protein [Casimicrobiaceae bacterium]|nr:tripartite tricarboxylate transporter substrate binding protein [Pseudomonadota bacterium]
MLRSRLFAMLAGLLLAGPLLAAQTDWPTRPVTLLVPFPAGGTVDIIARTIGQKLGVDLGQTFIVENRGGAGGTIGTAMLAHAAPDGYTLLVNHMGLAFNASLYEHLTYDTLRDVVPVAYVGATPNVLVVTNSFPAKTVPEFLALARAKPGSIDYGSGGVGSAGHLAMALLESATGVKLQHVPYKGNGPAIIDLISGQIQVILATIPAVMPYIASGKMRAIATSGNHRSAALPDLPTLDEAGVKGFDYQPWYGVFAPAGTPPAVLDKLHDTINEILADPEISRKLGQQGLEVQRLTRQQFTDIVHGDVSKWAKIIKTLGIKTD